MHIAVVTKIPTLLCLHHYSKTTKKVNDGYFTSWTYGSNTLSYRRGDHFNIPLRVKLYRGDLPNRSRSYRNIWRR